MHFYAFAVLVRMVARTKDLFWLTMLKYNGAIAKRLCRGLQSRLDQFDSGSRLQDFCNKKKFCNKNSNTRE